MRIVLDLGTSYAWRRPAVGIVRTERKFAEHLLARDDLAAAFCRFDARLGEYVAIPREHVRDLLHPETSPAEVEDVVDASPPPNVCGRVGRAARRAGRSAGQFLPEPLRPRARAAAQAGWHFAHLSAGLVMDGLRLLRNLGGPLATASFAGGPTRAEPFRFGPGDVYLSMGLDWQYNDLDRLDAERRRFGFTTVLFCYDAIPVRFPHLMDYDEDLSPFYRGHFAKVARVADRVVAISQTSQRDFLELMQAGGVDSPPVDVAILGADPVGPEISPEPWPGLEGMPFVLCVSSLYPHKNHEVLYNAWDRLAERHGDAIPHLVLVGLVSPRRAELARRFRLHPRLKGRVHLIDKAGDAVLLWLYRHCLFTVFPSLYEGWGLPVVESLALGKPCVCSTAPAVIEAADGLATAVDPYDGPGWAAAVEHLWLDEAARVDQERRIAREYRPPTWRDHGDSLIRIALEAATQRRGTYGGRRPAMMEPAF